VPGVRLVRRSVEIPAASWDALAGPGDFYLTTPWLATLEETSGAAMGYLLAEDPGAGGPTDALTGGLAGGLATALAEVSAPWLSGRPDTLLARCVRESRPGAEQYQAQLPPDLAGALMPALVCGGRHLGRTRLLSADGPGARNTAERLLASAERLAVARGARSVAFLYVDEEDVELRQLLEARGYAGFQSSVYCRMTLPPGGFESYLSRFSSVRRRSVLAERRRLARAGVEVRVEPLTSEAIPRLAELEAELLTKYGMTWTAAQSELILRRALAGLGRDALVSVARSGADVLGFALLLRHRDQWFAHRAGFDYEAQGRLPVYFEALFYALAEEAPAAGVTGVHYGTGSAEAKVSRGCTAADQYAYVLRLDGPPPGADGQRPTVPE